MVSKNRGSVPSTKLKDLATAARLKGIIERIADRRITKAIPPIRYAVVSAVDTVGRYATAGYPDEAGVVGSDFKLRMGGLEPSVGSLIRVAGPIGARYIDDVLSGVVTVGGGTSGGGGGAAAEAQFGFGGVINPSVEVKSAPYVMAAALTVTKVIVTMSKASASSYTIKIYRAGTLVSTHTVTPGTGLPANPATFTVSIAVAANQALQASVGAATLADGENLLVVCR